jgi:hypothetical protein
MIKEWQIIGDNMRYLQTYKLFESVSDDAYDKWISAKTEYDAKISELKAEYLEGVKQCMFDLTDNFNHTSSAKLSDNFRKNSGGDLVAKIKFDVITDRIDEFFDTLEEMEETVKSYISQYRRIQISSVNFMAGDEAGSIVGTLYRQNIYSIKEVRTKIKEQIEGYKIYQRVVTGVVIEVEI